MYLDAQAPKRFRRWRRAPAVTSKHTENCRLERFSFLLILFFVAPAVVALSGAENPGKGSHAFTVDALLS